MQPQNNLDKISHITSVSIYELLADTNTLSAKSQSFVD